MFSRLSAAAAVAKSLHMQDRREVNKGVMKTSSRRKQQPGTLLAAADASQCSPIANCTWRLVTS